MKIIKRGNTKRQFVCEYCGAIIEYDIKEDVPASGIRRLKIQCPTCDNNTIIHNTKLDVDVEKTMKSMIAEKVRNELINTYNCIDTHILRQGLLLTQNVLL